jgi:DNA polymerase-3 subunit delta
LAGRRAPGTPSGLRGLTGLEEDLAGGLGPAYLLVGDDRREIDQAVAELERRAVDPELVALNAVRLRGPEDAFEDVVAACSTLPMLGERRYVLVREPEKLRGEAQSLVAYLEDPAPTSVLVLVPVQLDRRLGWVKPLEARCKVVTFAPPEGRDLDAWIRRALQRHGVTAEPDALALLVDMVQADTLLLENEIEKVALCCAATRKVTVAVVESILGRSRTLDAWALTNAIEDGDRDAALAALRRLLEQGSAVPMLVGMIDWCLGRLLASEEPRAFPSRQRVLDRRRDALRGRAERVYASLREADRLVRTTGGNAEAALERAVLEACF